MDAFAWSPSCKNPSGQTGTPTPTMCRVSETAHGSESVRRCLQKKGRSKAHKTFVGQSMRNCTWGGWETQEACNVNLPGALHIATSATSSIHGADPFHCANHEGSFCLFGKQNQQGPSTGQRILRIIHTNYSGLGFRV